MGEVRTSISVSGPNLCVNLGALREAMDDCDYREFVDWCVVTQERLVLSLANAIAAESDQNNSGPDHVFADEFIDRVRLAVMPLLSNAHSEMLKECKRAADAYKRGHDLALGVATCQRLVDDAAADHERWPERSLLRGRREQLALAIADCVEHRKVCESVRHNPRELEAMFGGSPKESA